MKKKILITGAGGFVGMHALNFIERQMPDTEVWACSRKLDPAAQKKYAFAKWVQIDMLDALALDTLVKKAQPNFIIHLASASSVGYSWQHPRESTLNNLNIYLNLLEAVRTHSKSSRVLSVGSSEVYGKVEAKDLPLKEECTIHAASPYGVARASQEALSNVYRDGYGVDIISTRSFNHFGPGQDSRFALPSFARQIAEAKNKGHSRCHLKVGNIDVIRDFTDVRDVVEAYFLLLNQGTSGRVYNICSGKGQTLKDIIEMMGAYTQIALDLTVLPELVRPQDLPIIVGSNHRLHQELGWLPRINFKDTVKGVMDEWTLK